jgi:hypothetical protein
MGRKPGEISEFGRRRLKKPGWQLRKKYRFGKLPEREERSKDNDS